MPLEYRDRIIHRSSNLFHFLVKPRKAAWARPYILGQGRNKVVCWRDGEGLYRIGWVYRLSFWHLIMVNDFSISKMISVLLHRVEFTQINTSIIACFWYYRLDVMLGYLDTLVSTSIPTTQSLAI